MAVASVTRVAVLDENERLTAQNNQNSVCNEIHSVDSLTAFPGQYGQGDCPVSILYNDLVSRRSGMACNEADADGGKGCPAKHPAGV